MNKVDPLPRSDFSRATRREKLPWPAGRPFRLLAIDGGGIRGIFPAEYLAQLEARYLDGQSIGLYFDMIAGTSTGGILALGLGAGLTARHVANIYEQKGGTVFPGGRVRHFLKGLRGIALYRYSRSGLTELLQTEFGDKTFGDSQLRLCIPSFDGTHGEVYIFKTPHHPDYKLDKVETMLTVAEATAAAPTYFAPRGNEGYQFIDGGVWANNPVMIGVVDALTCFDIEPRQLQILNIGCGDQRPRLTPSQKMGGFFGWRSAIFAAMDLQSQNALGQARLLVGPENILRIEPNSGLSSIALDDYHRAAEFLPQEAIKAMEQTGFNVSKTFLLSPVGVPAFYM